MGPIVHRIDTPLLSGAVVGGLVQDAIHHRVADVNIGMRHVDFGTQYTRPIGKFACFHAIEQVQVLLNCTVTVWGIRAWLSQSAPVGAHFFRRLVVDIGFPIFD